MKKQLYNLVNKEELKEQLLQDETARTTLSFYQYAYIADPHQFRDDFYAGLSELMVFGRIYVAQEGINGQISAPTTQLDALKNYLYSIPFLEGIRLNIAIDDDGKSFYKLKIKVRPKIVADGLDDSTFDATKRGTPLSAADFNELTESENTIVVDMRNHYESEVGYFKDAILPDVETFREALPVVEDMLEDQKDKHIVMYCTGGIRCEKASAYYLHRGFENVYMVEGGIIDYARQCEAEGLENKFIGKNFVFDERMGERISEDVIAHCHQCGAPCDTHVDCANDACHLLFIQCEKCAEKYNHCCSTTCADFIQLPKPQQQILRNTIVFNGLKFGKGRYKAAWKDPQLEKVD
ncbi:MAG: rhodanese-related sulfurtransferase [Bacteroidota bacterium]